MKNAGAYITHTIAQVAGISPEIGRANGQTPHGRGSRWPRTRPTPVKCGDLVAGKCEHKPAAGHNSRRFGGSSGRRKWRGGGGGHRAARLRSGGRNDLGTFRPRCHWWAGLGGGVGGLITHKYRWCIIVLSINKSVEPNKDQKVLTSSFDQGFTINTSKQVFGGI
jgi:hypothetical protein